MFDSEVLSQLVWLRKTLSLRSTVDRYLYAILLGILHANARSDGTPRGLTIAMPNTFSMAPRYVIKFARQHRLEPPQVDVLTAIEERIGHLGTADASWTRGRAWLQDATLRIRLPKDVPRPTLIFTSPPYLEVMKYGKLNWLRLWLLGKEPRAVDASLFASSSLSRYLTFMSTVIRRLGEVISENGRVCLVIGDVKRDNNKHLNLAHAVASHCVQGTGLTVEAVIRDALPVRHKVSRIWGDRKGHATKTDRILILRAHRAPRLPSLPAIDWGRSLPHGGHARG